MKLATYRDGSRDGQLVVVSRDLGTAHYATGVATRLQQVLDDWNFLSPQLEDLSATLNHGKARHAFEFDPKRCMAPLPRAFHWARASGTALGDPIVHGPGDDFLGPAEDLTGAAGVDGVQAEGRLAVLTGDIEPGAAAEQALEGVRLLMLSLQVAAASPGATGCAAFGPVAVTPDELGEAWQDGRVTRPLQARLDGKRLDAGPTEPGAAFGPLLARLCRPRGLRAGAILAGPPLLTLPASTVHGAARLRIEWVDAQGQSVFGAIDTHVGADG